MGYHKLAHTIRTASRDGWGQAWSSMGWKVKLFWPNTMVYRNAKALDIETLWPPVRRFYFAAVF